MGRGGEGSRGGERGWAEEEREVKEERGWRRRGRVGARREGIYKGKEKREREEKAEME